MKCLRQERLAQSEPVMSIENSVIKGETGLRAIESKCRHKSCKISSIVFFLKYFAGGSDIKNLHAMQESWASVPVLGRYPEEGKSYPFQYSGLENSMDFCKKLEKTERLSLSHVYKVHD